MVFNTAQTDGRTRALCEHTMHSLTHIAPVCTVYFCYMNLFFVLSLYTKVWMYLIRVFASFDRFFVCLLPALMYHT